MKFVFWFFPLALLISLEAGAQFNIEDVYGSYAGKGNNSAWGQVKMVFHLQKGLTNDQTIASFRWSDSCGRFDTTQGVYFDKVIINKDSRLLTMRLEFPAQRELGKIINELKVEVLADGSLQGIYQTNSMTADGTLLNGQWTATQGRPSNVEMEIDEDRCGAGPYSSLRL